MSRNREGKKIEIFQCKAHPKCFNSWEGIGCDDWTPILPDMKR